MNAPADGAADGTSEWPGNARYEEAEDEAILSPSTPSGRILAWNNETPFQRWNPRVFRMVDRRLQWELLGRSAWRYAVFRWKDDKRYEAKARQKKAKKSRSMKGPDVVLRIVRGPLLLARSRHKTKNTT